ncbi:adenine glycosylase [Nocardioides gansuensis]|uniref:Adenine DNA glycosylase n=1 Tax=Nocardioides gansuensis TaxID=2138300 RepID=A0A2T8F9V5_9ACTN|nr:A/G-specific adenine glycosylase [Nocardioides gansuensis]PVG82475.1 adenine glycosylase [Nocardioides gansuensis]
MSELHAPILDWYAAHARDLPWRHPDASPWSVLVSEVMLQQTPVSRVLPAHDAWLQRWPTPAALAADAPGDAVRMWGRLGYPRRALRLHAAALAMTERHGGEVPSTYDELRALPGIGDYTASAVLSFAFGQARPVLDTNVRRVHWRTLRGAEFPPDAVRAHERRDAAYLLPDDDATAATWSVAVMELGALVCTARDPRCGACPVAELCAWRAEGHPPHDGPPRRGQAWAGTDRQCRGRLMAVVREADGAVHLSRLEAVWADDAQRDRCLAGLVADGLLVPAGPTAYALP